MSPCQIFSLTLVPAFGHFLPSVLLHAFRDGVIAMFGNLILLNPYRFAIYVASHNANPQEPPKISQIATL